MCCKETKTLQNIYFNKCSYGEKLGVLSNNKLQNEIEQNTTFLTKPTISGLQHFTKRYEIPFDGLNREELNLLIDYERFLDGQ